MQHWVGFTFGQSSHDKASTCQQPKTSSKGAIGLIDRNGAFNRRGSRGALDFQSAVVQEQYQNILNREMLHRSQAADDNRREEDKREEDKREEDKREENRREEPD